MVDQQASMEDVRKVIRAELDRDRRSLMETLRRHDDEIGALHREMYGYNGTPGLTTKVDANTRHAQRVTWYMRTMLGGFVAFLVGWFTNPFGQ